MGEGGGEVSHWEPCYNEAKKFKITDYFRPGDLHIRGLTGTYFRYDFPDYVQETCASEASLVHCILAPIILASEDVGCL